MQTLLVEMALALALAGRVGTTPRVSPMMTTSWYDSGVRLRPEVESWYDAGIRLHASTAVDEEMEVLEPVVEEVSEPPPKLTASAEASLAAAAISAVGVLGIDVASFGVIENVDAALLVGGLALSQVDSAGPVGTTLRAVGNVTSFTATEVVMPAAKGVANFYTENEIGYKGRALLEMGIERALYAFDPDRKAREEAEAAAEAAAVAAAAAAAAEQERKDALPWWSPDKYT
jgi:hypothetical protein